MRYDFRLRTDEDLWPTDYKQADAKVHKEQAKRG